MRLRRPLFSSPSSPSLFFLLLALTPSAIHAADLTDLDCAAIEADGHTFNLKSLGGPHSVVTSKHHAPSFTNTTWTIDICGSLKRKGDVAEGEACPDGTRGSFLQFQGDLLDVARDQSYDVVLIYLLVQYAASVA
jgi:hypothetical protein